MELPIVNTLNEQAEIIKAVKITRKSGVEYLKPLPELDPGEWLTCVNSAITMALWRHDKCADEETNKTFDTSILHERQQQKLAEFMGIE
jgi:hypothetical protein